MMIAGICMTCHRVSGKILPAFRPQKSLNFSPLTSEPSIVPLTSISVVAWSQSCNIAKTWQCKNSFNRNSRQGFGHHRCHDNIGRNTQQDLTYLRHS